ncbi:hypothetical protein JYT51_00780 [Candidatus Amoebophilus asiaticus]|nr:hypothetical protein [Candidatus Amoebophilus asiaticus]
MWKCHYALNWSDTLANGLTIKHPDCNGDGIINDDDTLALNLNFNYVIQKTNPQHTNNPANPELYFEVTQPTVAPGADVEVRIMAGKDSVNLYGLA